MALAKISRRSKSQAQPQRGLEPADFLRARRALMRQDLVLATVIRKYRARSLLDAPALEPFPALVRTITSQQISTRAAATIHGRLVASMSEGVTPEALLALSETQFRGAGLSRQKVVYLRDLATKVQTGELPVASLHALDDEAVVDAIVKVKGLGRWSAEMFLMFRLRRPDVLPVGDLGIVTAIQRLYGLRQKPTPARMMKIGEAWRPYRTVACWYLWRSLENDGD
ncbi:MAG: DNA-3-methyladenine glycosylase 2 family protein [Vicinamibacterales bacterium]